MKKLISIATSIVFMASGLGFAFAAPKNEKADKNPNANLKNVQQQISTLKEVYKDERKEDRLENMKDRLNDRRDELKNQGQQISTLNHVYRDLRKEVRDDMKDLKNEFKENVKDAVYGSVYRKTYKGDLKEELDSLRGELKDLRKGNSVAKMELIRKISKMRKANNDSTMPVFVNGTEVQFDVAPLLKEGRTLVPVSAVVKALDATVTWDAATRTVTITKDNITIKIVINSKDILVNGVKQQLEVPAQIHMNRTVLPIRAIMEAFSKKVVWDDPSNTIVIDDNE